MTIKAVAFDLDGVIIDSVGWFQDAYAQLIFEHSGRTDFNMQQTFDAFAKQRKASNCTIYQDYWQYLIDMYDMKKCCPIDLHERSSDLTRIKYEMQPVRKGVQEVLTTLKKRDIKLALVTSAEQADLDFLIRNKSMDIKYFDIVICSCDVMNKKPNPEPYLLASKKLGIDPKDMVAVEDSINGVESAVNAGIGRVIIFNEKHSDHDRENINSLTPHNVNDFSELLKLI